VIRYLARTFPDATLKVRLHPIPDRLHSLHSISCVYLQECHYSYLHFEVNSLIAVSRIFKAAEKTVAAGLPLMSYSISQNNLDNVSLVRILALIVEFAHRLNRLPPGVCQLRQTSRRRDFT